MVSIEGIEAWPMQRGSIVNAIDNDQDSWTYSTKGWCNHDSIYIGVKFAKDALVGPSVRGTAESCIPWLGKRDPHVQKVPAQCVE